MPQYRLHADCYLPIHGRGAVRPAGSVIEYDGTPGSQMEPLDDEARERFDSWLRDRKRRGMAPLTRFPFRLIEAKATTGKVRPPMDTTVPDGWRDLKGFNLTNLAKRLGAPFGVNLHAARAFIEDLERKQNASAHPPMPPQHEAFEDQGDPAEATDGQ